MELLEDPGGELTIDQVSSPEFVSQFTPSQVAVPNYGFTDSVYWVRLSLDNQTPNVDEWIIEVDFSNTQYVDLYTPLPNGEGFDVRQTGSMRPVSTRDVLFPRIVFDLTSQPRISNLLPALRKQRLDDPGALLWTKDAFFSRTEGTYDALAVLRWIVRIAGLSLIFAFTLRESQLPVFCSLA